MTCCRRNQLSIFGYCKRIYEKTCCGLTKAGNKLYRVLALRCLVLSGDISFRNTQRFSTKKLTPERSEFPILFFLKVLFRAKNYKKIASRIKFCFQPRIQKKTKRSEFRKPGFHFFYAKFQDFFRILCLFLV